MLENNEPTWHGKARDTEHAEEKCFWDESPASLVRYTLQYWGKVKLSSSIKGDGWVTVYKDECLRNF